MSRGKSRYWRIELPGSRTCRTCRKCGQSPGTASVATSQTAPVRPPGGATTAKPRPQRRGTHEAHPIGLDHQVGGPSTMKPLTWLDRLSSWLRKRAEPTCCEAGLCTVETCKRLPRGKTCDDCVHWSTCLTFAGIRLDNTRCAWFPRQFEEKR